MCSGGRIAVMLVSRRSFVCSVQLTCTKYLIPMMVNAIPGFLSSLPLFLFSSPLPLLASSLPLLCMQCVRDMHHSQNYGVRVEQVFLLWGRMHACFGRPWWTKTKKNLNFASQTSCHDPSHHPNTHPELFCSPCGINP